MMRYNVMFQDQAQRQLGCEGLILCIIMVISAGLQRRYNLSLKRYCRDVFHLTSSSSGHIRRFFCFGHEHEVSLYLPPSSKSGNHIRSGYLKTLVTCLLHCNDDDDQQNDTISCSSSGSGPHSTSTPPTGPLQVIYDVVATPMRPKTA